MATNKTIVSEIFYHKTSAMRFELGTFRDATKFKIEIVPQAKDPAGNPIEKKFDYEKKLTMVFGLGEILRIKRFVEQLLNPQKQTPQEGYSIEHFFEVGDPPEKKKSVFTLKRVENKNKDAKSPYGFSFTIIASLYSSLKNSSVSFGLTEEEAYWIINTMPHFSWAYMIENARVQEENRAMKVAGGSTVDANKNTYKTPAPGAEELEEFDKLKLFDESNNYKSDKSIDENIDFDDVPF
jgi:hypothetical protein